MTPVLCIALEKAILEVCLISSVLRLSLPALECNNKGSESFYSSLHEYYIISVLGLNYTTNVYSISYIKYLNLLQLHAYPVY